MIDVSIIVPVHNSLEYIEKCLFSLVNQTIVNKEIIIVDDGSSDGSYDVCISYQQTYPKLIKVFKQNNKGVSSARNVGIINSHGKYIGFVDSDDYIELNMFEKLLDIVNRNIKIDSVFCGYDEIESEIETYVHKPKVIGYGGIKDAFKYTQCDIKYGYYSFVCNKLFLKSNIINNHIFFDENIYFGEDNLWLVKYILCSNLFYFDNTVLYHWVRHNNSATTSSVVNEKRITSVESQKMVIDLVKDVNDKSMLNISKAKMFCDGMNLLYISYISNNKTWCKYIRESIEKSIISFMFSSCYSVLKRCKYIVTYVCVMLNLKTSIIIKVFNINRSSI